MKILLLEDNSILSDILFHHLKNSLHEPLHVSDGKSALNALCEQKFDLLILDINVPKMSGLEVIKEIRSYKDTTPAIIITAFQDTAHLKKGFENGCDDYIKKPFDLEELDLRIKNIQKRFGLEGDDAISIDKGIVLMPSKNRLHVEGKEYILAHKECEVLRYLVLHKNRVVFIDELIQNVWEYDTMPSDATIRVYIKNLRHLLGKQKIHTIRGNGYCFE